MKSLKTNLLFIVAALSFGAVSVANAHEVVNPVQPSFISKVTDIWGIRQIKNGIVKPVCSTIATYPKTSLAVAVIAAAITAYTINELMQEDADEAFANS